MRGSWVNWFDPRRFRPELLVCEIRDCVTQGRFGFTTLLALHSTACYVNSISVCVCVCVCSHECVWNQGSCWLVFWNMWLCTPSSDWYFKGVVGSIILNNIIMDFDQPLLCDCINTQQLYCTVRQICFWNWGLCYEASLTKLLFLCISWKPETTVITYHNTGYRRPGLTQAFCFRLRVC